MEVARDLIQRYGSNAMSYADLSTAVGIRKASIHYHFPKKDDLILALIADSSQTYGKKFRDIVEGEGTCIEKLQSIVDIYYKGVSNGKMCLVGTLSTEFYSLSDTIKQALRRVAESNVATFEKAIIQGIQENQIDNRRDSKDLAYTFNSAILGAQIFARSSGQPEQFLATMRAFLEAIKTSK